MNHVKTLLILSKLFPHKAAKPDHANSGTSLACGYAHTGTSLALGASGTSCLMDGTLLMIAGEFDVMGDPIQQSADINGQTVSFEAIGVGAVRLDTHGAVEALAAGGLKRFIGGGLSLELPERLDYHIRQSAVRWAW